MWETFISWYINTYLGKYVENLNSQQLSFALGQGELELENVPLKKNIFRSWGLPVEVKASVVGRIKIEFNLFKYLRNEPVLITIEDVYVVAGALNLSEWDPVEEELLAHDSKMDSLDSHEARWKAQFDISSTDSSYYSSLYFSSMRIGASIVTKVVENLQLNVRNVHIRFEEPGSSPGRVIAFGVTLEGLTVQSCDSSWNPLSSSVGNASECSFKTLQLSKFGVYCDTRGEPYSAFSPDELKAAMSKVLALNHEYLLCPVSAEARIAKNNSPSSLSSSSKPRFDVHLVLDKVPLQLTDSQYKNTRRTYRSFMRLQRHCRLRHYRPYGPVNGNVPEWWGYAFRAVLTLKGYKRRRQLKTMEEVLQRARDNVAYVKAYEQHLIGDLVSLDARQTKDRVEQELHYDEILELREIVMLRMERRGGCHAGGGGMSTSPSTAQMKKESSSASLALIPVDPNNSSQNKLPPQNSSQQQTTPSRYGIMSWVFPSWSAAPQSEVPLSPSLSNMQLVPVSTLEHSASSPQLALPSSETSMLSPSVRGSESDFDEAIMGDVKAFGRDALLARFTFKLDKGTVSLSRKSLPFLEFDFTGVQLEASLKPRSGSHKFQMTLSTVSLKDCRTKQLIVTPHHNIGSGGKIPSYNAPSSLRPNSSASSTSNNKETGSSSSRESLFSLTYEKKPHKKAAHKIVMTSRPLDLILSPEFYEDVVKFFRVREIDEDLIFHQSQYEIMKQKTKEELRIYWERLVDQHASNNTPGISNWEIYLDISAPQIIIFGNKPTTERGRHQPPSGRHPPAQRLSSGGSSRGGPSSSSASSSSSGGSFVVIDLGRFRFTNVRSEDGINSPAPSVSTRENETENSLSDNEDDEEFLTPCSSPLPGDTMAESSVTSPGASILGNGDYLNRRFSLDNTTQSQYGNGGIGETIDTFYSKLYKNYSLEITDIHVIVVDARSSRDVNWRAASCKNTSGMHLIDKFSVDVQLERRLVYSEDPMWPALTVIATLPKLTFHVNESKVNTVRGVIGAYFSSTRRADSLSETKSESSFSLNQSLNNLNEEMQQQDNSYSTSTPSGTLPRNHASHSKSEGGVGTTEPPPIKTNSRLVVAQFTVQHVSVDIQSRDRNIAELQILGARTVVSQRSGNTEITFVIQSLLLADAVQTFGPDFQLLLASHKHVCMDTVSGSLRDSEPTSPMSPQPPASPLPQSAQQRMAQSLTMPSQLHEALLASLRSKWRKQNINAALDSDTPLLETDALITADLTLTSKDEDMAILHVQFNNLDVIANQETWVEIFQFIQKLTPRSSSIPEEDNKQDLENENEISNQRPSQKLQANFEFRRLNVLLLRGVVGKDGDECARKIATATASDSKINLILNKGLLTVDGSLGGLQMLNLTPEGQYHQRVLSVGQDPLVDPTYQPFVLGEDLTSSNNGNSAVESALTFNYERNVNKHSNLAAPPKLVLRMASVIYTHCPIFLVDLKKCISQFQEPLTTKLKSAAAQIALGLVRQDAIPGLNFRSSSNSLSGSLERLDFDESCHHFGPGGATSGTDHFLNYNDIPGRTPKSSLKLDVVLDSPVIVLPRHRNSAEVLVANLGQISVVGNNQLGDTQEINGDHMDAFEYLGDLESPCNHHQDAVSYNIFVCDISLYSLNLSDRWRMVDSLKMTYPSASSTTLMRAQELYQCDHASAIPILHNTVIHLTISYMDDYITTPSGGDNSATGDLNGGGGGGGSVTSSSQLHIQGRVISALKVSLTPKQYAQVLDSLGNIATNEDDLETNEVSVTERRVNWQKEVGHLRNGGGRIMKEPLPLPSPTHYADDSLPIKSSFEISELIVELALPVQTQTPVASSSSASGAGAKDIPHLTLSCSELSYKCDKRSHRMEMDVCLKALKLEDTSVSIDSPRRVLASSKPGGESNKPMMNKSSKKSKNIPPYVFSQQQNHHLSKSCPDLHEKSNPVTIVESPSVSQVMGIRGESASLPDELDPGVIFSGRYHPVGIAFKPLKHSRKRRTSTKRTKGSSQTIKQFCPVTPPPSPRPEDQFWDNLVHIKIIFIDPKSPDFITKYEGMHKHTRVDFNILEVLLIPETFACLRQFFSDASKHGGHTNPVPPPPQQNPYYPHHINQPQPPMEPMDFHHKNTETVINVRALMVKLARTSGEVAEAEVNNVHCELKSIGMNWFGVSGTLGSLEIRDISPFAGLYPLKFVFQGEQALDFDYVRESCDAKFRLKMSSIVCVHTNRFYTEFTHLWSSLFGSAAKDVETPLSETATSTAPGQSGSQDGSTEAPIKVTLDIQAGAPVIILPYSAMSEKLLIVDLGHLAVKNKFILEAPDMILNVTSIDLIAMDLYSGDLVSQWNMEDKIWKLHQGTAIVKSQGNPSFLKKKCALNLKMRRYFVGQTPESQALTFLHGTLSTVHCTVNSEKFRLVRGLLQYNIGEPLEPLEEVVLPYNRSSARQNIQSRLELGIELELVNVILEILKDEDYQLSRIDFLKSKFTFQSNSDGTKDVDLASQEILICDIRLEPDKNCFKNILQQSGTYCGVGGSSASGPSSLGSNASMSGHSSFQGKVPLQAEIHYRQSQRGTNVTIVLNNMRLMLILDWWMEVLEFIFQKIHPPKPHPHQEEDEKEKSKHGSRHRTISPLLERSKEMTSTAITVSAGIVTKRAPVLVIPESTFELKMNVSSCELVLVEDPAVWDSNAIILKSTAMLGYRPHLERPISCSLLECELFSCILGLESETALSILDPTNIQIELVRQAYSESQGILDATLGVSSVAKILRVQSPNLSLRLSYYDMKMFFKFLERFSKEAKRNLQKRKSSGEQQNASVDVIDSEMASTSDRNLGQYGFPFVEFGEDALATLDKNEAELEYGDFREGGDSSPSNLVIPSQVEGSGGSVSPAGQEGSTLCGIEVKCNFLSLCVIDDCRDADVPLLEVGVQSLELSQNCVENCGTAECVLTGDYYNRALSGWEPFLEPWKCTTAWQKNLIGKLGEHSPSNEFPSKAPELELSIFSKKILDLNITSTLLTLYRTVSSNWSEDYQLQKSDKRRAPFVPFALRNETGSALWFRTILSENDGVTVRERVVGGSKQSSGDSGDFVQDATGWIQVNHLSVQSFSFEGRVKLRHRNTHQIRTHQLALKVDGWQEVTPVSVDKVGTYFRIANPMMQRRLGLYTELPPTRLVFEVSLEGAAQKLVTVRSALQVKNSLPDPVELKLENTIVYPSFERAQTGGSYIAKIQPGKAYPIPLHSVWAHMWIRPLIPDGALISQYSYCTKALLVTSQDNQMSGLRECTSVTSEELQCYRFCVAVQRDDFPADDDQIIPPNTAPSIVQLMSISKRANLITLKSPFRISNLLPHEVTFEIRSKSISGHIASGKDYDMTNVDTSEAFEIIFTTETFSQSAPLNVSPSVNGIAARLKMVDAQKRIVFMTARVRRGEGGTVTIALSCPVWIINKSGLPMVCKQEGTSSEAAGQFKEHEVGRMVTPLLFSFADQETSEAITLRVGNGLHKDSKPYWCRAFLCQNGTRVRKLAVSHSNNRPESVYMVGVEVKSGSGRYRDTKLVVISPRFVVDNRSPRRVQISQRVFATSFYDAAAQATHLTLTPDCNLPFHWPRLDRDQLLCIKLVDIDNGLWSGGFPIDNVDSFHVNIRDRDGNSTFLRVEIVLQGSTYFIILNGTEQLPPPFRIDNLGFVPVSFHQACVGEERLKLTAKAESSLAYALDEPTQPAHLTLEAPGGQSVIVNMDVLGSASMITYENFFYIALTATFPPEEEENVIVGVGMESLNMVLEVTPGSTKVILAKKEPGKLSQLWRVNSDGLVEHEGSRPLGEPTKQSEPGAPKWVLDIAGSAPQPSQCVALTLRRPEKRRASTQHWEFTNDGRLKLSMYANMYVQAKDGFGLGGVTYEADSHEANGASWKLWSDVVLGPPQPVCYNRTASGIPAEQAISRHKLRGGSGQLNLEVLTDGPTRVVRICDEVIPPRIHLFRHTFEASNCNTAPKFKVKVDLKNGLGISVVSCYPREELVYCKLSGMMLEWTESKESQIVKAAVENLQIDNQLHESEKSVVMYVTASERFETVEDLSAYEPQPALRLSWESMKSKLNAHVFKYWELEVKPLNVVLEERLLLKVCNWMGVGQNTQSFDGLRESDFEVQKAFTNTASLTAKRFYFGMLKILLNQVRLSVLTSSKLPPELAMVKRRLGLTLIRFEDAIVDLDTFIKYHPFETFEFLLAMVVKHYRDELMSQAAVILGSTDFLGNPLGFVNDVSVGVSGLIYEGSVFSLVKNVTHGISNSAAKVTGSLGEVLGGRTILDDKHEEERRKIKEEHSGDSAQHLYAGLKGFGHGFIGGITSIATQSYEGLSTDGMSGLITGIGKGIIGTVTKPAVGVLDLAAGAAYAIRDSSQTSSRMIPPRVRPTRVVIGTGGLLPSYSETSARGQELLYDINDRNYKELFIGYETLKSGVNQDFKIMIASEAIIVFKPGKGYTQLLRIPLSDLIECRIAELNERGYENSPYIEFVSQVRDAAAAGQCIRPQVVCESDQVAKRVVQQVNYAKVLYEELRHSQKENPNSNNDD